MRLERDFSRLILFAVSLTVSACQPIQAVGPSEPVGPSGGEQSEVQALDTKDSIDRGDRVAYASPGDSSVEELCFNAPRFPGAKYGKKDAEQDAELCSYNFYKVPGDSQAGEAVHVCPKLHSTNPGLEIHRFKTDDPANSGANRALKESFEKKFCKVKSTGGRRNAKKLAKFKQTITCSYTGSIISSYHLSRMLGNILQAPNAVLRTMDRKQHWRYVQMGTKGGSGTNSKLWASYKKVLKNTTPSSRMSGGQNRLLTTDGRQIYGAMQENPRGEYHYQPKSGVDRDVGPLAAAVRKASGRRYTWDNVNIGARRLSSKPHKLLESSKKVSDSAMKLSDIGDADLNLVHRVKVLKDIGDMYVFDYILAMNDRPGNIHFKPRYYFKVDDGAGGFEIDDKKVRFDDKAKRLVDKEDAPFDPNSTYGKDNWVVVPRIILKDNDCGARPNSYARKKLILERIRHIGLSTYKRLRWLATQPDAAASYMTRVASYDTPYKTFGTVEKTIRKGIVDAAATLYKRCKAGKLFLDLMSTKTKQDLEAIRNYSHSASLCEQIYTPK